MKTGQGPWTLIHVPGVLKLLVLLGQSSVDVLTDGGDLKLGPLRLRLLRLERCLGLFQSRLEFLFFHLQSLPRLVHLVNASASLAQLVRQVVNLVCKR